MLFGWKMSIQLILIMFCSKLNKQFRSEMFGWNKISVSVRFSLIVYYIVIHWVWLFSESQTSISNNNEGLSGWWDQKRDLLREIERITETEHNTHRSQYYNIINWVTFIPVFHYLTWLILPRAKHISTLIHQNTECRIQIQKRQLLIQYCSWNFCQQMVLIYDATLDLIP